MPRSRKFATALVLSIGLLFTASCGDGDDGPMGLDPSVFQLTVVSGGGQSGLAGTVLSQPLIVRVSRIDTDAPEEGVTVEWRAVSGSAEPTRTRSATDENGEATTRIELGDSPGQVTIRASVAGLDPVDLAQLSALPVPQIVSLSATSADPGDIIEVRVSDLPASFQPAVLFNGVSAQIVNRIDGSPTVLDVEVPPPAGVCSATSESVNVRLRVAGVTTAGPTLSVSVPADPFQVGQVLVIEGTTDVQQCALLPTGGGTAKYLLVALSAAFEQAGEFEVTLGGSDVVFTPTQSTAGLETPSFHSQLRELELRLARKGLEPARAAGGPQLLAQPDVGDTRQFWVVNDPNPDEISEEFFDRVTATLEFVGVHTLLYVDDRTPEGGLTDADIQRLGEIYDRFLYDADVDFFGHPSDFDDNDRVIILLTPTVNTLTDPGARGVVIGFTFALDLFSPSTSNCSECRFSNGGEIFYGIVPDPNGEFGDSRTTQFVLSILPGVMVHETQHMIDFFFKLFENNLLSVETLWLSEALAHAAEEVGGDIALERGETELANDLYDADFNRAAVYLLGPDTVSLTATGGQGSAAERGGWWLFIRWLADQYGDFIFRDLTQARENGLANVEARTGEDFFRLFADFAVATWADDLDIPGLDVRYQIPKWELRSILRVNPDGPGDPVYALQPVQTTFQDLSGPQQFSRFLGGSSAFYVEVDANNATQPLQLELSGQVETGLAILRFE